MLIERLGKGNPVRLFVSGLHGDEYKTTDPVLENFSDYIPKNEIEGKIVLFSLKDASQEYVSTLEKEYYETEAGRKLLSVINSYQPPIYLELHSYSNYSKLTDENRMEKDGVPPLVDLGSGILAGSVSPFLRRKFHENDFCFLLDIPKGEEISEELLKIMGIIARGENREEIFEKLSTEYPEQMKQMVKHYLEFYERGK